MISAVACRKCVDTVITLLHSLTNIESQFIEKVVK